MTRYKLYRLVFASIVVLAVSLTAWSQATTSVRGAVTDPSGATIPNANVTLANQATGLARQTSTGASGIYTFTSILPGTYTLTVKAQGFRTSVQKGVVLEVNLPATVNVRMQVGAVSQTVQVTSQAPPLNTTNASIGNVLNTTSINQLPLDAENMVLLLSFQPGVVYNGENILQDYYDTRAGSVDGERSDQNNITLDGVDNNDEFAGYAFNGVLPTTQFSVQEFRVTTSDYTAAQGRSAGAQIAMVTRGGTNQFHGSLYEFNRSDAGEANDYFLKAAELANDEPNVPPQLTRNLFGGTLGGPFMKNRFFFFVNYQGERQAAAESITQTIPSATLREGIIEYQCATASQCPGGSGAGSGGNSVPAGYYALGPTQLRQMDPLGIGPSQVALKYFQTYPEPNNYSTVDVPNYAGYTFGAPTLTKDNWYIGRLDYKVTNSGSQTLFFRWTSVDDPTVGPPFLPGQSPTSTSLDLSKGFVAGYTAILSPTWVNSFRYGLTRGSYSTIGDTSEPWVMMRYLSQPINYSSGDVEPVYNFIDTMNGVVGTHDFSFGANVLFDRLQSYNYGDSFSDAVTNSDWVTTSGFAGKNDPLNPAYGCAGNPGAGTSAPCYPSVSSGFYNAYDFPLAAMMGIASEIDAEYNYSVKNLSTASPLAQGAPVISNWAADTYGLFAMDTWHIRHNLSLNYGLNYQLMLPMTETDGQEVTPSVNMGDWFDQRKADMEKGIGDYADQVVAFSPAGSYWGRSGLYQAQDLNFAPRFGAAWSPEPSGGWLRKIFGNQKSSLRGGFGMYYDNFGPELALNYASSGEIGLSSELSNPASTLTVATSPRITGMNVIPTTNAQGVTIMPAAPPSAYPAALPAGDEAITNGIDQSIETPYSYAADFSFERSLPGNITLDADYVGHFGNRLLDLDDIAEPLDLKDPKTGVDYFTAVDRLSQLGRANTPDSSINASLIGPTAQYWEDMLTPQSSYPLCSTGASTASLLEAVYDVFGPNCNLYNETSGLYDIDVAGFPTTPKTGLNTYYNSQYSSLWTWSSMAWSNYNALELSLHKQFSNGVLFGFNYTYSHALDVESEAERGVHYLTDSVINAWDPGQMYGPSDFDLRHQINAYWVARLPFGRGGTFARNAGGVANAFIGGWQLSGTTRWSTGYPASVYMGYFWPTNWDEMGWADLTGTPIGAAGRGSNVGGVPNVFTNQTQALNAFTYAYPGQSGARNPVRGDGFFDWDMSLAKSWTMPWSEHQALQFRWNVYNVTNTVSFDVFSMQDEWDSSSTFGDYTSTLSSPRVMELSLIYRF